MLLASQLQHKPGLQSSILQRTVLQNTVVVFSKNYLPMNRIPIKRAIALLVTGLAEPVEFTNCECWQVRSANLILQVPAHIRLTIANPERHWKVPPVNRRGILQRDNHTCQYCGTRTKLTLDHVIPRSSGGLHTWDNVVAACVRCNGLKGSKPLFETGLTLRTKPKAPIHPAVHFSEQFWATQET